MYHPRGVVGRSATPHTASVTDAKSSSPITNQLGFHSQLLSASSALAETAYGLKVGRLAQGARRAIELQLMLGHSPMGIALNEPAGGELLATTADPAGTMAIAPESFTT